jgi:ABC-type Mn2+/Zn2+ transport system ATPase subunit
MIWEDLALKDASKLSGGQQQRVCIARALINDPAIIMGDEPTGNLDSKNTQTVFEIFKELAHEFGQAIIAVTHDLDLPRPATAPLKWLMAKLAALGKTNCSQKESFCKFFVVMARCQQAVIERRFTQNDLPLPIQSRASSGYRLFLSVRFSIVSSYGWGCVGGRCPNTFQVTDA